MVKPIGHLKANIPPKDKVNFRTRAKFTSPTPLSATDPSAGQGAAAAKKQVKYKKRKK